MSFSQAQLDAFWQQYVGMNCEQVRIATTPGTDGYLGANWEAMLDYVLANRLYGFADYSGPVAGNRKFIGTSGTWWNGPTKS